MLHGNKFQGKMDKSLYYPNMNEFPSLSVSRDNGNPNVCQFRLPPPSCPSEGNLKLEPTRQSQLTSGHHMPVLPPLYQTLQTPMMQGINRQAYCCTNAL
uniref:Uncharacterized protein n=2 Tax=Anopheles albimanus TaxID=7167 RepID=A0A182F4U7_ANOAL